MQTQDNTGVIIAFISCLGVGAIVALEICAPTTNNIQAITIIIGFLTPTVVGMLGLMKSQENGKAIDKMHNSTDSTLSQISLNAKTAADKADVAAVNIEAAVKNGHTIVETANKIAETVTKTAQNVEAIKQNGH